MVNILVTGGAGFIGSHIVDILIERGHHVRILDDLSGGFIENVNPMAEFIKGSILDKALVEQAIKGTEIVYHLAAYAAEGLSHNIRKFNYMNNLIGSINIINAAIKNKVKRFVLASSIAVYGTSHGNPPFKEEDLKLPEDPYGIAKYAVELDLQSAYKKFGLEYTILRPYNVYGERQFIGVPYRNVFGIFMNRIMQSKNPKIFGDGNQKRAFTYIGDVAPAIVNAGFSQKAKNEIINIGGGKVYTVNEIAEEVLLSMSSGLAKEHLPPRYEVKHAGELSGAVQWGVSDVAMEALKNLKMVEAARFEAGRLLEEDETLAGYAFLLTYFSLRRKKRISCKRLDRKSTRLNSIHSS